MPKNIFLMKLTKIKEVRRDIEVWSSHDVNKDTSTGELEIVGFDLSFRGDLSEWLEEYLTNPVGSRLHKNLVRTFRSWFE